MLEAMANLIAEALRKNSAVDSIGIAPSIVTVAVIDQLTGAALTLIGSTESEVLDWKATLLPSCRAISVFILLLLLFPEILASGPGFVVAPEAKVCDDALVQNIPVHE